MPIYIIRLILEWGGLNKFDVGNIEEVLPISEAIRNELCGMIAWHEKALDWGYPPDPSPWNEIELQKFETSALVMINKLKSEPSSEVEIVYVLLGSAGT